MAETNLTSCATNGDRDASSPNVSSDAPPARGELDRRQIMQLITSAAAVPALALASPMPALASELGVDRTRWTRAKGRYLNAKRGLYEARGRDKERAIERLDAELDALLAVPSPSPKVFGEKLRILECEYGTEAQPRHLAAIYRDARALG